MYAWLWKTLPGNTLAKIAQATILFAAVAAVLWLFVYPIIQDLLTVDPSINLDSVNL